MACVIGNAAYKFDTIALDVPKIVYAMSIGMLRKQRNICFTELLIIQHWNISHWNSLVIFY
jgi:hypothetical protein